MVAAISRSVNESRFDFRSLGIPADRATADGNGFAKDVSGTGSTVTRTSNGLVLTVNTTTTADCHAMIDFNDELVYDIDLLQSIEFLVKANAAPVTGSRIAFGVASAVTSADFASDSYTEAALFKCEASTAVVLESDDGTTNVDDVASGVVLGTDWQRFAIHFDQEPQSVAPPGQSKGGKGNVHFYAGDAKGRFGRVGSSTLFDMSAYAAGLQPFAFVYCDDTDRGLASLQLHIAEICVVHKSS